MEKCNQKMSCCTDWNTIQHLKMCKVHFKVKCSDKNCLRQKCPHQVWRYLHKAWSTQNLKMFNLVALKEIPMKSVYWLKLKCTQQIRRYLHIDKNIWTCLIRIKWRNSNEKDILYPRAKCTPLITKSRPGRGTQHRGPI